MSTNPTSPNLRSNRSAEVPAATATQALFVDLDGTLIATDLFAECLIRGCLSSPKTFGRLFLAAFRGRAALKRATAEVVTPNVRSLPFRSEVIDFINEKRATGCRIVLATASDHIWAERIADELMIFDDVIASDGQHNLKGRTKLEAIRRYCRQHGHDSFSYVGDSGSDLPIWSEASTAYVVPEHIDVAEKLHRSHADAVTLPIAPRGKSAVWKAMRPWQWLKNALIFGPLILAHQYTQLPLVLLATVAFIAMSLCASGIYLINDLMDIESDRLHPRKKFRPLAAGTLSTKQGVVLSVTLLATALTLAATILPTAFLFVLVGYLSLTTLYSLRLKREAMADVITLAGLYTLRLIAGGAAVSIAISDWLLVLSIFLFTSLAFAKRHAELFRLEKEGQFRATGRGYVVSDLALIRTLGPCSGYLAVLIFALYSQSDATRAMYTNSAALWTICFIALFWVSRLWLIAIRGQLNEDPVVFALRDRVSLVSCVTVAVLLVTAANGLDSKTDLASQQAVASVPAIP